MFAVISWLVVGIVIGLGARALSGGPGPRGFFMTALTGIAGSVAGGALAHRFHLPASGAGGFLMAVIGAVLLIAALNLVVRALSWRGT
jgi:uncharacterized membrane protein YeaQ/YmgE (transglycosylase-associated protein family)